MYFIHRGTVEVVSEHDEPIVFDTMGEGRFFGEISVVFSCPRTASIRWNGSPYIKNPLPLRDSELISSVVVNLCRNGQNKI